MKLTIKTLQQSTFKIEIEPENTVKDLKEKIEKEQGKEYPCGAQKLIYSGKILADANKLAEYNFDEKKFVVLMITRPPPVVKSEKPESEGAAVLTKKDKTSQDESDKSKNAEPDNTSEGTKSQVPSATQSSPAKTAKTTSSSTTPSNPTTRTNPAANVTAQQASVAAATRNPAVGLQSAGQASLFSMDRPVSSLEDMMANPHFRQIQNMIQQSPHLLNSEIQALAASDPQLYSFITDHSDMFFSALNHPPLTGSRTSSARGASTGEPQAQSDQQSVGSRNPTSRHPPQSVVDHILVDVSEHDKEAIERLKELGFSEYLVVQAYIACNKDEQLEPAFCSRWNNRMHCGSKIPISWKLSNLRVLELVFTRMLNWSLLSTVSTNKLFSKVYTMKINTCYKNLKR